MNTIIRAVGFISALIYVICQFTPIIDNKIVEKGSLLLVLVSVLISFAFKDKKKEA